MSASEVLSGLRTSINRLVRLTTVVPADDRAGMIHWRGRLRSIAEACALAAQEQRYGNLRTALHIYNLVVGRLPNCGEAHNNRAATLQLMGLYEDALAGYDRAIAIKPGYATAHFNRGLTLRQLNRLDEALASYERALKLDPENAEYYNSQGVLLQQMKRYDEGLASYQKAVAANPGHAGAYNNWGTVLMSIGNIEKAEALFRKACRLQPGLPDPLFNLTRLRRYQKPSAPEIKAIRALLKKTGVPPENKEHLLFALAKIYDDCGMYDEAFELFLRANRIRNGFVNYKAAAVTQMAGDVIEIFNRDFLTQRSGFASESRMPLFIIGMCPGSA